jgi:neutral ceramidase
MKPLRDQNPAGLQAGAAVTELTPAGSVFLFGYPHVPRLSSGVHDPLECAALYLRDGAGGAAIFLANDLIFVGRELAREVRRRIAAATGVPEAAILISATHTHSGPVTVDYVSNAADPVVPRADPAYLRFAADRMVEAAERAWAAAQPAEIGLAVAHADGVGTNRHDPAGPADPDVPVLVVRAAATRRPLAAMVTYAMHPTVLHEDSTVISGDFPFFTRRFLRGGALPADCPVLYHNGASGNQSPRHVTRANTLPEAQRLGELLGQAIAAVVPGIKFLPEARIAARIAEVALTPREFPAPAVAVQAGQAARERFEALRRAGAPRTAVRTAECDWFGAEETAELARAAADGRLADAVRRCSPAEVQAIAVGPWRFVGWPGEFFVEYALAVRAAAPQTFVVTMANGELQGYIVTAEAAARGVYEATNALFHHANGPRVVAATLALLQTLGRP